MAEGPGKGRTETTQRQRAERDEQQQDQAQERTARGTFDEGDPDDDPREEEGWTQPESSAQKGAERDEG